MFVVYLMFLCFEEEMDGKDEELTKHILNGKGHTELSGRLRAHVTEDAHERPPFRSKPVTENFSVRCYLRDDTAQGPHDDWCPVQPA